MCFSRRILEQVAWSGDSITEDIDYTLRLIRVGVCIQFAPDAVVRAQMPTSGRQAASQRQRWEGGRYGLLVQALRLLGEGLLKRRPILIDRAVELIIPPFAELNLVTAVCLVGAWMLRHFGGPPEAALLMWGWLAVFGLELAYLVIGLVVARAPLSVVASLAFAPFYIVWKIGIYGAMMVSRGAVGWRRTERHEINDET